MSRVIDGTQMYQDAIRRIQELEKLNSALAAEVDRMRPVVDAAVKWSNTNYRDELADTRTMDVLSDACDAYEASAPKRW